MKIKLLDWIVSPCCAAPLRFSSLDQMPGGAADIETGALACSTCGHKYPIVRGVPRLLPPGQGDAKVASTAASFSYEWSRYPGTPEEDERIFLEESQLKPEDLKGKLILDAGCGMGRYSMACLNRGAEVVAMDLSMSLERLVEAARREPNLHVVQGDLHKPPLRKGIFDLVYSHGVLHHTSDTRKAFMAVSELVKPEGLLSVWLYGMAGKYEEFATNPLRTDRAWVGEHRRLAWMIVGLRHFISDSIRLFTTRLPLAVAYAVCYPLTVLGAIPGLKYLTFSVHPKFKVRLIENFDWISPHFQFHHTKEELASWYEEAGFDVLSYLPHGLVPKPGILGRRRRG